MLSKRPSIISEETDSDDSVTKALVNSKSKTTHIRNSSFRDEKGNPYHIHVENERIIKARPQNVEQEIIREDVADLPSQRRLHLRGTSESSIIDRRRRQPSPLRSRSPTMSSNTLNKDSRPSDLKQAPRQTSGPKYTAVPTLEDSFEEIDMNQTSSEQTLTKRKGASTGKQLRLDTDMNGANKGKELHIPKSTTSAISPEVNKQSNIFGRKTTKSSPEGWIRLKPTSKDPKRRTSSTSSNDESRSFVKRREEILKGLNQNEHAIIDDIPIEEGRDIAKEYHKLVRYLNLDRVFFDPEFEIINRFCLEYTAQCAKTESHALFRFGAPSHYQRVFESLEDRANSIGTPTEREHPGPHVPVLLTRLILGEFRIKSEGKSNIGINVPLFSHHQRLNAQKFGRIVERVFERKQHFESRIDISGHGLSDRKSVV